jgi:hypothetical protein
MARKTTGTVAGLESSSTGGPIIIAAMTALRAISSERAEGWMKKRRA